MVLSHFFNLGFVMLSLLGFLILTSAYINANSLVSETCSQTQNPFLCNQVLGSAPGASTTDLKGLGYISINIALTNAKQTSPYIASLVNQSTDLTLRDRYQNCAENYASAIDALNNSKMFLDKGDIPSLQTFASTAFDGPDTCCDNFEGPPVAPDQLNDANEKLEGLISIVLTIGGRLARKE